MSITNKYNEFDEMKDNTIIKNKNRNEYSLPTDNNELQL